MGFKVVLAGMNHKILGRAGRLQHLQCVEQERVDCSAVERPLGCFLRRWTAPTKVRTTYTMRSERELSLSGRRMWR